MDVAMFRLVDELEPWAENYNQGDVSAIARSIQAFGFNGRLATHGTTVMAGNHALAALVRLCDAGAPFPGGRGLRIDEDGAWLVLTTPLDHLSRAQAEAFAVADLPGRMTGPEPMPLAARPAAWLPAVSLRSAAVDAVVEVLTARFLAMLRIVARPAEGKTVGKFIAKVRRVFPGLDVVDNEPAASGPASLAGVAVALQDRTAPGSIAEAGHSFPAGRLATRPARMFVANLELLSSAPLRVRRPSRDAGFPSRARFRVCHLSLTVRAAKCPAFVRLGQRDHAGHVLGRPAILPKARGDVVALAGTRQRTEPGRGRLLSGAPFVLGAGHGHVAAASEAGEGDALSRQPAGPHGFRASPGTVTPTAALDRAGRHPEGSAATFACSVHGPIVPRKGHNWKPRISTTNKANKAIREQAAGFDRQIAEHLMAVRLAA